MNSIDSIMLLGIFCVVLLLICIYYQGRYHRTKREAVNLGYALQRAKSENFRLQRNISVACFEMDKVQAGLNPTKFYDKAMRDDQLDQEVNKKSYGGCD